MSIPESLGSAWGERFRCWHRFQTFSGTEIIQLIPEMPDLTYRLNVFDYQFKFILPERVEFLRDINDGKVEYCTIKYKEAERLHGVFRYPMNEKGFFMVPLNIDQLNEEIKKLSEKDIEELIRRKKVLTFEAFRIPFSGFKYYLISGSDFEGIGKLAGTDVSSSIRRGYEAELESRISAVKKKIKSLPDYLLILQNILDLKYRNEKEISVMTDNIIHFGA
jgi:hypothetical protein